MKHLIVLLSLIVAITGFATGAVASEKATPAELIQKVNEAVRLVEEKGEDAFEIFRDKNGPFVWKDSYLFVIRFDGVMLMHPIVSKLEGRNMLPVKDTNGKLFNAEAIALAKDPGQGWTDYMWVKPGEKKPSPKVSYVKGVPGKNMLIGAGIYDITKEQAVKASN